MNIKPVYETSAARTQEIIPFPETRPHTAVTVYQYKDRAGTREWRAAEVNWPSIGGCGAEDAKAFAEAIVYAAKIATKWTKERQK